MPKALITGITGQDGAYLAQLLLEQGYDVIGVSPRRSSPNYWRLEKLGIRDDVDVRFLDITCYASVLQCIQSEQFDEVYNLAAQSFVAASFKEPLETFNVNAVGCMNILEALKFSSTKFYQASTSEMFGLVQETPQTINTPFYPRSPYGIAKLAAHWSTINYRESYDMFACCGVLFNHESPLRGEQFVTRKIVKALARIRAGKQDKLELGNLSALRDWGHAKDYVRAMWLMLQQDKPKDYVIATGENHSVEEFLGLACALSGVPRIGNVFINEDLYRPADVEALLGNATPAKKDLNWEPEYDFISLVGEMVEAENEAG